MQKMPSIQQHDFSKVAKAQIDRSKFNRSHGYTTTLDADYLYPVFVDEILPGDTIDLKAMAFGRINTLIFPLMDNVEYSMQYFFVPTRLLWTNFPKFMGEQLNPGDSIDFTTPQVTTPSTPFYDTGSLFDYMGIPTKENITNINALHSRAYNLIWNDWYRDENLQNSITVDTDDGPDTASDYVLQKRNKKHDYFTSCLPWPQKGDAVALPLAGLAPITGLGIRATSSFGGANNAKETDGTGNVNYASSARSDQSGENYIIEEDPNNSGHPNIRANLNLASGPNINEFREAMAIQKLLERSARSGTRYTEIVKGLFNVSSPDSRLQRPEYLGGGSTSLQTQEVAQTSSTDGTSPQANMSAQGKIMYKESGFTKSFTEHGVVIGLCSVRADLRYQQGLNKMWTRQTRLDYFVPDTANLGEQAVLNQEIFADGSITDTQVFGYQERWAEMRYFPSLITGKMRSNATGSLDPWHLAQEFSTLPVLDSDFVEENVPMDRIVALTAEPDFTFDMFFNYLHTRPIPTYSIPGLGNRF